MLPERSRRYVDAWLLDHNPPEALQSLIRFVVERDPVLPAKASHKSRSARGCYVSRKMGIPMPWSGLHTEGRAGILYDGADDVYAFFPQPMRLEVEFVTRAGYLTRKPYVPDYLVLRTGSAVLEEWKTERWLNDHRETGGKRYILDQGRWRQPCAETAAREWGLEVHVRAGGKGTLGENLELLAGYTDMDPDDIDEELVARAVTAVRKEPGITYAALRELITWA